MDIAPASVYLGYDFGAIRVIHAGPAGNLSPFREEAAAGRERDAAGAHEVPDDVEHFP